MDFTYTTVLCLSLKHPKVRQTCHQMAPVRGGTLLTTSDSEESPDDHSPEDFFNPTLFNDEPFVNEVFHYGDIAITLYGYSWNAVQSSAGVSHIGHTLWAAGHFLADYLYHNPDTVRGKRILEVGCGLGLTGLMVGKIVDNPADVLLTDGDRNILDALQLNIDQNFPTVTSNETGSHMRCRTPVCAELYWGERVEEFKQMHGQFDLIIGADVLYSENSLELLVCTTCALLNANSNSRILFAFQTKYGGHLQESLLTIASKYCLVGRRLEWTSLEVKLLQSTQDENLALELWEFCRQIMFDNDL